MPGKHPNWNFVLGLTGGLGTGKSTVLALFKKRGAFVLDADAEVHRALKSPKILKKIRSQFGAEAFSGGKLDRKGLAKVIFSNKKKRSALESLLHPVVRSQFSRKLSRRKGRVAVCDVPLLFENGWPSKFDAVAVVGAPLAVSLARLKKRGLRPADAKRRMKAQWPLPKKMKKADFLIRNGGSIQTTKSQVDAIWDLLMRGTHGLAARKQASNR